MAAFQAAIEQSIRTVPPLSMGLIMGLSIAAVVTTAVPTRPT